jgi:hypothetical protein
MPVMPKVAIDKKEPLFSASLDGISFDGKAITEIKCPMRREVFELAKDGIIEPYYEVQVQWQLMVSKAKKCSFFVYHPEWGSACVEILPDKEKHKELVKLAYAFWDMVQSDTPPEKNAKEYKNLPQDFEADALNYKTLDAEEKAITSQKKEIKDRLCQVEPGNYKGFGLTLAWMPGKATVDWESLCKEMGISDDDLARFTKPGKGYFRITMDGRS